MSKITDIKAKITELEGGAFQELCDALLSRKGYEGITSYGLHSSSMKTTKGNPDTYFKSKTGKYIFVMYTTQQSDVFEKAKEDIKKCLDSSKTGIAERDIEEIIYCHTSSNLSAGEDKALTDMCKQKDILFSIYGVDNIASEIYRNYKILAKDHLGLSLDTNQILEKPDFVNKYDSNEMMAPLSTTFQFRQNEYQAIFSALETKNVICVIGKAGIGKTRLSLEVASDFSATYKYKFFCIKSMDLCIFEDISSCVEKPGKYLFLIDDANELIGLNHILGYVNMRKSEYDIKIILTLRDYTAPKTILDVKQHTDPCIIPIDSFTDEQIKTFLDVNLEISNPDYAKKIIRIAEGNPRIAYMAGKLVKKNQSIEAIADATQLYENYYDTYLQKSSITKDRELCLAAGIISLLHTVNLANLDCLDALFAKINIAKENFISMIHKLCEYEYVEIKLDQVAIISDQCLRNYMLYYTFFNKRMIPFAELLEIGFRHFRSGITNATGILWNVFNSDEVTEYLKSEIEKVWEIFKQDKKELFYEFIKYFHIFNLEETLLIAKEEIEKIESDNVESFENVRYGNDTILELLSGYRDLKLLPEAIDLMCEYVIKVPSAIKPVMKYIETDYSINKNSHSYGYYTTNCIFDKIKEKIQNQTIQKLFLELTKHFIAVLYRPVEAGRGHKIVMYTIPLVFTDGCKGYRSSMWEGIISLCEQNKFEDEIVDVLKHYSEGWYDEVGKDLFEFDKTFIVKLVSILWKSQKTSCCVICNKLKNKWKHYGISCEIDFNYVFKSELWQLYDLFSERYWGSELTYDERNKKHEQQIVKYALSLSDEKIANVLTMCNELAIGLKNESHIVDQGLDFFAKAFGNDKDKLLFFLQTYFEKNTHMNLNPYSVIDNLFKWFDINHIYALLWNKEFIQRDLWKYVFFEKIPTESIYKETSERFLEYLKENDDKTLTSAYSRNLKFLDNYLTINPQIYYQAVNLIIKKQEYSPFVVRIYLGSFFNCYAWSSEEVESRFLIDIGLLQKMYFTIARLDKHMDHDGKFLKYFVGRNKSWIQLYAQYFYENIDFEKSDVHNRLAACWELDDYMEIFDYMFNYVISADDTVPYSAKFAFKNILLHEKGQMLIASRQEEWILNNVKENAYDSKKIKFLFEVLSELGEDIRRKAISLFVQINKDYNLFSELPLEPNHWGGMGSMIPCMKGRVSFYESLLPYLTGIELLQHKQRIQAHIKSWNRRIKEQEVEELMESLYQ